MYQPSLQDSSVVWYYVPTDESVGYSQTFLRNYHDFFNGLAASYSGFVTSIVELFFVSR